MNYKQAIEYVRAQGVSRDDARYVLKMAREGSYSALRHVGGRYVPNDSTSDCVRHSSKPAGYSIVDNEYRFAHDGDSVTVDRDRLRTFIKSYVKDGANVDFIAACRRAGIPEAVGRSVRAAFGVTKSYPPFLPDEYNDLGDDDIIDALGANRYARLKATEERLSMRQMARELQSYRDKDAWLMARLDALGDSVRIAEPIVSHKWKTPDVCKGYSKVAFIGTHDLHFGKRSAHSVNDINEERKSITDAIRRQIDALSVMVGEVVMVFGSDMFNVDNVNMQTTRGTQQNNIATMGEMADTAVETFIDAVNYASRSRTVTVYVVSGNHDRSIVTFASSMLKRVFERNDYVDVVGGDDIRQYHACGDTIVCMHHGDIKVRDESTLRIEAQRRFPNLVQRRMIVMQGHLHKFAIETKGATVYTTASSGGPQCKWEYDNFGLNLDRAITTYIVRKDGPIESVHFEPVGVDV